MKNVFSRRGYTAQGLFAALWSVRSFRSLTVLSAVNLACVMGACAGAAKADQSRPALIAGGENSEQLLTPWSSKVIDKCSSVDCYDFKTPYGVYKLNDPTSSVLVRSDIERFISGKTAALELIFEQVEIQGLDMMRAGCTLPVDAFCGNGRKHNESTYIALPKAINICGGDVNFGKLELSRCVDNILHPPSSIRINPETGKAFPRAPRTLQYLSHCTYNGDGDLRSSLNPRSFEGSIDAAISATFDTQCLAWQGTDAP